MEHLAAQLTCVACLIDSSPAAQRCFILLPDAVMLLAALHWGGMRQAPLRMALSAAKKAKDTTRSLLLWSYEQRLAREVRADGRLPGHLGLIMDGNRRYAKVSGIQKELGHTFGADKAHEVLQWCLELGIPAATIWVLSTDNKGRDPGELAHIFNLLEREARNLATDPRIHGNRVQVRAIGQHSDFPPHVLAALQELEEKTAHYTGMRLNIAVGYGGREEIVDAVKRHLAVQEGQGKSLSDVIAGLCPQDISDHLYAADIPDPDFIIRTSGEIRLSGFMLWQSVYSEFYFCDVYWPGFRRVDFLRALRDFQGRQRRFGR